MLQRDAFIQVIYEEALSNRDIYFLSADFGSETLDSLRVNRPDQFLHCGISEQHMIDMAAGLSLAGKKVYAYAMGPFLALRCYEQIKCSLAMMNQPVTLISSGIGLGYADSGPTHYLTEDIACLRALHGIEIYTPADIETTVNIARLSLETAKLRYIRLDRSALPAIEKHGNISGGFYELKHGNDVCILSSGYSLHRSLKAHELLFNQGTNTGLVDLFRIKPVSHDLLAVLDRYKYIVTVEEQCLPGGFGSAVLEFMSDNGMVKPVKRLGLQDRYYFENGGRELLLNLFGLSVGDICAAVNKLIDWL